MSGGMPEQVRQTQWVDDFDRFKAYLAQGIAVPDLMYSTSSDIGQTLNKRVILAMNQVRRGECPLHQVEGSAPMLLDEPDADDWRTCQYGHERWQVDADGMQLGLIKPHG
jgi:hypothetical protein